MRAASLDCCYLLFAFVIAIGLFVLAVGGSHPEKDSVPPHGVLQPQSAVSLTVQGSKPAVQSRSVVTKNLTPRMAGKAVAPVSRRTKIRNYNVKDDSFSNRQ